MKKAVFYTLFFILTGFAVYSQDTIVQNNGERILCRIQREDDTRVYYTTTKGDHEINAFINKVNVASVRPGPGQVIQADQPKPVALPDKAAIGIGMGLDHGGFGGNLLLYPHRNIGLFVGAGYAMAGVGYNFGLKFRMISEKHTSPASAYLLAMYGYNAAIAVTNATQYNKLFYGPSFGLGFDYRSRPEKQSYWNIALLLPIRGTKVDDYMTDLKNNHGVEFKSEMIPIAISIGYRFIIN